MDAISLVQTAEGALEEFGSIVQRMRILAVQANAAMLSQANLVPQSVLQLFS